MIVLENIVGLSELEEGVESEDEVTSGRKRIMYSYFLDDVL